MRGSNYCASKIMYNQFYRQRLSCSSDIIVPVAPDRRLQLESISCVKLEIALELARKIA